MIAFKAVAAGDTTAASRKQKKQASAKGLSSGAYTFWQDDAANVGASRSTVAAASVQACLDACDMDATCAAVVMTGLSSGATTSSVPTACSLVRGDARVAQFKRSATKAAVSRLTLASAFA